ncbi:MAG: hypothetical protein ACSHWZ_04625 [Sulfitobacter sp.]
MTAPFKPANPFKLALVATVFGVANLGAGALAGDRIHVAQASSAVKLVYVRQATELPDQRAARAAAARAQQRAQRTQRTQRTRVAAKPVQASDASMLELSPANMPSLPAAHIAVD